MTKSLSITLSLCAIVLTVALLFVCWKVSLLADTARMAAWNLSAVAYNAGPTVDNVNHATGVWAQASQKQADAADALIRDLRVLSWHTDRSFLKLDTMLENYATIPAHLNKLADAGAGTAQEATKTIQTANTTIQAVQPVISDSDAILQHFDNRLTDPRIDALMDAFRGMADSGNGILADGRAVSDKIARDYLTPKPWYRRAWNYAGDAFDVTAFLARRAR